jgi:hypothetical protein
VVDVLLYHLGPYSHPAYPALDQPLNLTHKFSFKSIKYFWNRNIRINAHGLKRHRSSLNTSCIERLKSSESANNYYQWRIVTGKLWRITHIILGTNFFFVHFWAFDSCSAVLCSSLCSQKSAITLYLEPTESSPQFRILFLYAPF